VNGIHDLGGMAGFGPVMAEADEPVFHHDWERRTFALLFTAMGAFGPADKFRHAIERMGALNYLQTSYYEHWLAAVEILAREVGVLSDEELATGVAAAAPPPEQAPPDGEMVAALIRTGMPVTRESGRQTPRFRVGERVRARNLHPGGHTRLPRYVRGRSGTIECLHGTHVFPDTLAHDRGENPQPLYGVKFAATELWGPDHPHRDHVYIDLWEDYLESADAE